MVFPHSYFYEYSCQARLKRQLSEVITKESPIYESLLFKRVAKAWDIRLTEKSIRHLNYCMPSVGIVSTCEGSEKVYWPSSQRLDEYKDFRVPGPGGETKRSIDEIPPEEIANAMFRVVSDVGTCNTDLLYRETLKLFGLSALKAKAKACLDVGMHVLEQSGRIS